MRVVFLVVALFISSLLTFSKNPFLDIENAVGYIVVSENGKEKRYVVIEGKDKTVKVIEIDRNPSEVLKKGGRR